MIFTSAAAANKNDCSTGGWPGCKCPIYDHIRVTGLCMHENAMQCAFILASRVFQRILLSAVSRLSCAYRGVCRTNYIAISSNLRFLSNSFYPGNLARAITYGNDSSCNIFARTRCTWTVVCIFPYQEICTIDPPVAKHSGTFEQFSFFSFFSKIRRDRIILAIGFLIKIFLE